MKVERPDIVLNIVISLEGGVLRHNGSIPAWSKRIISSLKFHNCSGTHRASYFNENGGSFLGNKAAEA
jgi:hypothetical protein